MLTSLYKLLKISLIDFDEVRAGEVSFFDKEEKFLSFVRNSLKIPIQQNGEREKMFF